VTSVGENEEKANTIQLLLLVFFSPSDMIMGTVKFKGKPPTLVHRIQELLKLNWHMHFNHTWREGNRSADWLANFSFSLNSFEIYVMETPPSGISSLLFDDIYGACMPRNVRVN